MQHAAPVVRMPCLGAARRLAATAAYGRSASPKHPISYKSPPPEGHQKAATRGLGGCRIFAVSPHYTGDHVELPYITNLLSQSLTSVRSHTVQRPT